MAEPAEVVRVIIKTEMDAASQRTAEAQFDQSMRTIQASAGKAEAVVAGSATKLGDSIKTVAPAANQAAGAVSQMSQMLSQGRAPLVSMTEQAISMAGALGGGGAGAAAAGGGIAGAASRVISFFGGPWSIGLAAAGFALAALTRATDDESSALDEVYDKLVKSKQQTALNEEADRRWANTIDGLTEAILRQHNAMTKRLQTDAAAEAQAERIAGQRTNQIRQRLSLLAKAQVDAGLDAEKARNAVLRAESAMTQGDSTSAAADVLSARRQLSEVETRQQRIRDKILDTQRALSLAQQTERLTQATGDTRKAGVRADPAAQIKEEAAEARARAQRDFAQGEIKSRSALNGILDQINAREQKRLDLLREQEKVRNRKPRADAGSGLFGNQVDQADAAAIARRAGFQVNSSERSTARQAELYRQWIAQGRPKDRPVAPPGSSAHEAGGSKWALDIQLGKGVTPESIRKAFAEEGVRLTKTILEHAGRVLHIEGARPGATVQAERAGERDAARAAREELRAAEDARQQDERFASEQRQLDGKIVQAKSERIVTMEQQLEADQAAVDAAVANRNAEYAAAAAAGQIRDTQAKALMLKNEELGRAQKMALLADDLERQAEVERALAAERVDEQIADAQYQVSISRTAKERLAASLRLLDLQQERERLELQAIIDTTRDGEAQHEIAERRLEQLNRMRAREEAEIRSANKSPMEQYREDLNQTAGQIDESMERIAVDGLETLTDGLTDAIMGAKSLGEVFDDVADQIIRALIRIAIQQMIIKPLGDLLGGLFGGGMSTSSFSGSGVGPVLASFLPGRAGGGQVTAGKAYWVGENGPEPFIPGMNGTIIPNSEAVKMVNGDRGGGAPSVSLTVNAPGATAETVAMIRRELAAAAPTIVAASQRATINQLSRTRT